MRVRHGGFSAGHPEDRARGKATGRLHGAMPRVKRGYFKNVIPLGSRQSEIENKPDGAIFRLDPITYITSPQGVCHFQFSPPCINRGRSRPTSVGSPSLVSPGSELEFSVGRWIARRLPFPRRFLVTYGHRWQPVVTHGHRPPLLPHAGSRPAAAQHFLKKHFAFLRDTARTSGVRIFILSQSVVF